MYQIIGVQRNQQQRLIATPDSARAARTHYHAALKLFQQVLINGPEGNPIDIAELEEKAATEC
jgi:hypothetical protein